MDFAKVVEVFYTVNDKIFLCKTEVRIGLGPWARIGLAIVGPGRKGLGPSVRAQRSEGLGPGRKGEPKGRQGLGAGGEPGGSLEGLRS